VGLIITPADVTSGGGVVGTSGFITVTPTVGTRDVGVVATGGEIGGANRIGKGIYGSITGDSGVESIGTGVGNKTGSRTTGSGVAVTGVVAVFVAAVAIVG